MTRLPRLAAATAVALCLSVPAPAETPERPPAEVAPQFYPAAQAHRPTPLPDRVILTWAGDPATSQAVTWRTDTTVTRAVGQIARAEGGPGFDPVAGKAPPADKVTTVPARTTLLATDLNPAHYHSVHFGGLRPATKYVYRVGDGANWTEWFQFETAADRPAPFGFVYFGDAQNDIKRHWSRVVRGAYSDMPKAKFILHAGDLVNRGPSDAEWGEWFEAAGWINGMVPSVPTPGNHEYGKGGLTPHWRAQFALPENGPAGLEESAYYFDVQGVRVVCLNSNERLEAQAAWLDRVLADNPNRWTVAAFHHPLYSTARGRDNKRVREQWRPLFDRYGVDLVLQGHDHSYGRSGLLREDNLLTGAQARDGRGTVYVVSVSGPKLYAVEPREWMSSKAQDVQLYQLIRVDGDRLHYESRTAAGDLYDEFELRKRPAGGNDLIEKADLSAERAREPRRPGGELPLTLGAMAGLAALAGVLRAARRR